MLRARAAGRRRDPVRRPDAAEARARARAAGFAILGTPFEAVDLAEDRERFGRLADELGIRCPEWGIAATRDEAVDARRADRLPGARAAVVRARRPRDARLLRRRGGARGDARRRGRVLVDRFLENAIEIDVDALCDGDDTYIAAVMQHVEEAGVHSGDSSCVLPAPSLTPTRRGARRRAPARAGARRRRAPERAARGRRRRGLRARGEPARVADGAVRVEGDRRQPRRGRVPARGGRAHRRARAAARAAAAQVSVKAAVLPFARFPGADPVLGPEMRSTGEVMASAARLRRPRSRRPSAPPGGRCRRAAGVPLRARRRQAGARARSRAALAGLGFELLATGGTARRARAPPGVEVQRDREGRRRSST